MFRNTGENHPLFAYTRQAASFIRDVRTGLYRRHNDQTAWMAAASLMVCSVPSFEALLPADCECCLAFAYTRPASFIRDVSIGLYRRHNSDQTAWMAAALLVWSVPSFEVLLPADCECRLAFAYTRPASFIRDVRIELYRRHNGDQTAWMADASLVCSVHIFDALIGTDRLTFQISALSNDGNLHVQCWAVYVLEVLGLRCQISASLDVLTGQCIYGLELQAWNFVNLRYYASRDIYDDIVNLAIHSALSYGFQIYIELMM